jgi:D-alanyl-D-alanine carboxypeptidase
VAQRRPNYGEAMHLGRRRIITFTLAALTTAGMAAVLASESVGATQSKPQKAFATALKKLTTMPGGPPGAIAVVQIGRRTQTVAVGVGDVTSKVAPGAGDIARIASVSKAYNGALTLALVSKGSLALTDTVGQILPTLPSAWSAVTVAQLLQHTSGVPDYIKSPTFIEVLQADPQTVLTPTQLLGYVANEPLLFPPGSKYDYSDSDNIIVGLMDEAVTKGTYEAALAQYVTDPLGLSLTTLPSNVALSTPYLHGYDITPGQPPEDISMLLNPGLAWASGGMLSTPAQLNTFMRAYVGGKFFNAKTRKSQFSFVPGGSGPPGPGTNSAGLAIYRYATTCGTVYGHTGNFPGYTIFAASNAKGTRSVDVVVNTQLMNKPGNKPYQALRAAEGLGVCAALRP